VTPARRAPREQPGNPEGHPPNDRADAGRDQRLREIVDQWFPLADWQREKLSLLLHPGQGRHDAA
jgi:hypothetical protein